MTTVRTATIIAAICGAVLLQGCTAAVALTVYRAEKARLAKLDTWKLELQTLDCDQLAAEHASLEAEKEALVDYDQRDDILTSTREAKNCALS